MHIARRTARVALIIATLPAVVILDALLGLAYKTDTNPVVTVVRPRSGTAHRVIVIFPGYVMPGGILSEAFAPHVAADDALVAVDYAERGVNVQQIFDKVMEALRTLKPMELRVYGASMGGQVGKLFLDKYRQAGAPYGRVVLVLDSAPDSATNVKRPGFLFTVSCWSRGGPLSTAVWAAVSALGSKPPAEVSADQDLVRAAHHAGAWVGTPAAASQACFMASFPPLQEGELLDVARQVVFLQGHPPDDDPLVRISASIAGWRKAFPALLVVTIDSRAGQWHLPLVERPGETARALVAAYP